MSPVPRPALGFAAWLLLLVLAGSSLWPVLAYIPASPTNDTAPTDNSTTPSHLILEWFGGGYSEDVSYQLVGADSDGISKVRHDMLQVMRTLTVFQGVLVHFSEFRLSNDSSEYGRCV